MGEDNDPLESNDDPMRPPSIPTLVFCLHCEREYDSWQMEWRATPGRGGGEAVGFWCCPTPGCDGAGFGFDVLPVDEDWVDPDGREMGWHDDEADPDTADDRPPEKPTPVRCERCAQSYPSSDMVWVDEGVWMCKTPSCTGIGFGRDLRPTDPTYVDMLHRRVLRPGEAVPPPRPTDDRPPF